MSEASLSTHCGPYLLQGPGTQKGERTEIICAELTLQAAKLNSQQAGMRLGSVHISAKASGAEAGRSLHHGREGQDGWLQNDQP